MTLEKGSVCVDPIKIESTIPAEKIHHIIDGIPIKKDVNISYEEYENRSRYIFSLNKDKNDRNDFFLESLSKFVQQIIIKFYSDDIVSKKLDEKLGILDPIKRTEIIEDVREVLNSHTLFLKEKQSMQREIFDYFIEHNTLIIKGYLKFRSKAFDNLVEKSIELVLGEFKLQVEYNEFIDMLKLLIETQTSEIDLINIICEDTKYSILDSDFNEIDNADLRLFLDDVYDEEVGDGDILLSTIIALNPKNIVMHIKDKEKDDLIYILEEIFEDRIKIYKDSRIYDK